MIRSKHVRKILALIMATTIAGSSLQMFPTYGYDKESNLNTVLTKEQELLRLQDLEHKLNVVLYTEIAENERDREIVRLYYQHTVSSMWLEQYKTYTELYLADEVSNIQVYQDTVNMSGVYLGNMMQERGKDHLLGDLSQWRTMLSVDKDFSQTERLESLLTMLYNIAVKLQEDYVANSSNFSKANKPMARLVLSLYDELYDELATLKATTGTIYTVDDLALVALLDGWEQEELYTNEYIKITQDPNVQIDANNLYKSIFNTDTGTFYTDFRDLISATATLEPFASKLTDMRSYPFITSTQKEYLDNFDKYRKPVFITSSNKGHESFAKGIDIEIYPATVNDLLTRAEGRYVLFIKPNNDTELTDSSTLVEEGTTGSANTGKYVVQGSGGPPMSPNDLLPVFTYGEVLPFWYKKTRADTENVDYALSTETRMKVTDSRTMHYNKMMLNNVFQDTKVTFSEKSKFLFLDFLGNIVTEDNVIVIPAFANGTLYAPSSKVSVITRAFHNHYPNNDYTADTNKGKLYYVYEYDSASVGEIPTVEDLDSEDSRVAMTDNVFWRLVTELKKLLSLNKTVSTKTLTPYTRIHDKTGTIARNLYYIADTGAIEDGSIKDKMSYKPFIKENLAITYPGRSITALTFPVEHTGTDELIFYSNLKAMGDSEIQLHDRYLADVSRAVRLGKRDVSTYVSSAKSEYSEVRSMTNVLRAASVPLVEKVLNKITGFYHLKDPQTHPATTLLFRYKEPVLIILVVMVAILLFKLIRDKISLPLIVLSVALYLGVFVFGLDVAMDVLVDSYNNFISVDITSLSDRASIYRALAVMEEQRISTLEGDIPADYTQYNDMDYFEENKYSSEINLYKLDKYEISELYPQGTSLRVKTTLPNDMYIEGKYIKITLSDLFSRVSIVDEIMVNQATGETIQQFEVLYKDDVASIEEYTPYYMFLEHVVKQTAKFAELGKPQQDTIRYSSGVIKKSYLWKNVNDSYLILDYNNLPNTELPSDKLTDVYSAFPADDLFNLRDMVRLQRKEGDAYYKDRNGFTHETYYGTELLAYYESDLPEYETRVNRFVQGGNYRIKKFLIDSANILPYMSDEVISKTIALILLEEFNTTMNNLYEQPSLYPKYVNMSKMNIEQLLFATNNDVDIQSFGKNSLTLYMEEQLGFFGHLLLIIYALIMAPFLLLVSWLPFLMLVMLVALVYLRVLTSHELAPTLKGFMKTFPVVMLTSLVNMKLLAVSMNLNYKLVLSGVLALVTLDISLAYIKAILRSPTDFGSSGVIGAISASKVGGGVATVASIPGFVGTRSQQAYSSARHVVAMGHPYDHSNVVLQNNNGRINNINNRF